MKQSHDANDNNKQIASSLAMTHARVPKLRFKEFNGEWDFDKMNNITSYVDYRGRGPEKSDEGIFLVTAKNIKKGYIDYKNSKEYVPIKNYSKVMSKGLPKVGDILFTTEAPLGNIAQVDNPNIALAQRVIKLRGKECIENTYLLHYMLAPIYQKLINRKAIGTTVQGISGKELRRTKVSFPKLPEQQKIANFLTAVDTKLQQLTTKKETLEQYKKGVMQQLFSQQLRFKPDVIANEEREKQSHEANSKQSATNENQTQFPDWEFPHANVLFKSVSDKKHNSDLPILAITQDQGAIPRELIDYNMIVSDKSVASYKVVQVGDFIISLRSFQGGIEYSNYHGICSPAYNILRPTSEKVNKEFYKRYLKTDKYIRQLQSKLEGIRDGKMISFKYFSEIKLPFPCFEEQQKIANYLSAIDKKIEAVQTQISNMQAFKKGLLQQMFV
ncbi:restriction endonuclease subunit S [Cellulophaga omnivescoria]|uniref:restriction endonuclease subunit S n=1 Tax=Cellulophaga omnivescoria TaxID=1888890 RepID=UPI0015591B44|nr:restriction endonuclease subunit S [Cellulophaga omnivescoria]